MTDRRRRAALRLPRSGAHPAHLGTLASVGERGSQSLLRERQSSSTPPESPQGDDNPFAPPPEGKPDQPWKPRGPAADESDSSSGSSSGSDGSSGPEDRPRSAWGSKWSSRQPGQQGGGFGGPGGRQGGPEGQGGPDNKGTGLRWDPTDPAQRRARYALLSGMWAFFCSLFDLTEIALLLGALALYWGISALRGVKPADRPDPTATPPARTPAAGGAGTGGTGTTPGSKPLTTAAVSGIVTAALALVIVATTFTVQIVYRDYYTCVQDSLTQSAQVECNDLLPKSLRPVFGVKE